MKLVQNVSNYIIRMQVLQLVTFGWSSDIYTVYTEHDFQVDLENFELNFKFHTERIQYKCR